MDYFKKSEEALSKVSNFRSEVEIDANRIKVAEVYARLAYAKAIKDSGK